MGVAWGGQKGQGGGTCPGAAMWEQGGAESLVLASEAVEFEDANFVLAKPSRW